MLISPGPGTPDDAGVSNEVIRTFAGAVPVLGVCLGHQCIGQVFGGEVVRAPQVMHGKTSLDPPRGRGVFAGLPDPLEATRYHSLVVDRASVPDCLEITAETDDGIVMGLRHREPRRRGRAVPPRVDPHRRRPRPPAQLPGRQRPRRVEPVEPAPSTVAAGQAADGDRDGADRSRARCRRRVPASSTLPVLAGIGGLLLLRRRPSKPCAFEGASMALASDEPTTLGTVGGRRRRSDTTSVIVEPLGARCRRPARCG